MSYSLGNMMLTLGLDASQFQRDLERTRKDAIAQAKNIESSFDFKSQGFKRNLKLKPEVDHTCLHELNAHLDKKEAHFKKLQAYLDANPLTPRVDKKAFANTELKPAIAGSPATTQAATAPTAKEIGKEFEKVGDDIGKSIKRSLSKSLPEAVIGSFASITVGSFTKIGSSIAGGLVNGVSIQVGAKLGDALINTLNESLADSFGSIELIVGKLGGVAGSKIKTAVTQGLDGLPDAAEKTIEKVADVLKLPPGVGSQVGREVKKGLNEDIKAFKENAKKQQEQLRSTIGEDAIAQEGLFVRAQKDKRTTQKKRVGQQQSAKDLQNALREQDAVQEQLDNVVANANIQMADLVAQYQPLKEQARKYFQRLISLRKEGKISDSEFEEGTKEIAQLTQGARNSLKDVGKTVGIAKLQDRRTKLAETLARTEQQYQTAIEKGDVEIVGDLIDRIDSIKATIAKVDNQLAPFEKPKAKAQARVDRSLQNLKRVETPQQPRAYMEQARSVVGNIDAAKIPQLKIADASLAAVGAEAQYDAAKNAIEVTTAMYRAIQSGSLSISQVETLREELEHAKDFDFGSYRGLQAKKAGMGLSDRVQATKEELASILPELQGYSPDQRDYEMQAKIKARRGAQQFAGVQQERVLRDRSLALMGSAKQFSELQPLFTSRIQALSQSATMAGINPDKLIEPYAKKFLQLRKAMESLSQEVQANLGDLDEAAIAAYEAKAEQVLELFAVLTGKIKQDAEGLQQQQQQKPPPKVEQKAQAATGAIAVKSVTQQQLEQTLGFLNNKQLRDLASSQGIDGAKLKRNDLMQRLAVSGNESTLEQAMAFSRANAQKKLDRRESLQSGLQATAEKAGQVAKAAYSAATSEHTKAAMQFAGSVATSSAKAALIVGKAGFKIAEAVEGVALDLVPGGRTIKGVGKNVVLPAAGFAAATHFLPGGAIAAQAMTDVASTALAPVSGMASNMLGAGATNVLSHVLPHTLGIQQAVTGAVTEGITAAAPLATAMIAKVGATVAGGRMGATTLGKTGEVAKKLVSRKKQQAPTMAALPAATESIDVPKVETKIETPKMAEIAMPSFDELQQKAIAKSKEIDKRMSEAYQAFKQASKSGDVDKAQVYGQVVKDLIAQSKKDIDELIANEQLLKSFKKEQGAGLNAIVGGVKGRLSQKQNLVNKELQKLQANQPKVIKAEVQSNQTELQQFKAQKLKMPAMPKINPELLMDLGVNTAGFAASQLGSQYGIVPELAGDLMGALAARGAATVGRAGVQSMRSLRTQERFQKAGTFGKGKQLIEEIAKRVQSETMQQMLGKDLSGDLLGWAVGNGSAMALNAVPGLGAIPMKGAAVASATVPKLVEMRAKIAAQLGQAQQPSTQDELQQFKAQKLLEFEKPKAGKNLNTEQKKDLEELIKLLDHAIASSDRFDASYKQANKSGEQRYKKSVQELNEAVEQLESPDPEKIAPPPKAATMFEKLGNAAEFTVKGFLGFSALAIAVPILGNLAGAASKTALEFQALERSLAFSQGSAEKGLAKMKQITDQANSMGLNARKSLEGYAQLSAATRETSLEGVATDQIQQGLMTASQAYGLSPMRQELVNTAVSQMAGKGVVSMEELRAQLGESLPGAVNIAARSLGVTTSELNKMVESGQVLTDTFLPKFAQQLNAELAVAANNASNSAQASLNRLDNSITQLQVTAGKGILPIQAMGADVLAAGLKLINDNAEILLTVLTALAAMAGSYAVQALAKLLVSTLATAGGMNILSGGIMGAIASLKALNTSAAAIRFVGIMGAIEIFKIFKKAISDAGGEFREFANSSNKDLESIAQSLNKVRAQKTQSAAPTNTKDLKGESLLEDTVLGSVLPKEMLRGFERGTQKFFGLRTYAQKQNEDEMIALGDMQGNTNNLVSQVYTQIGASGQGAGELGKLRQLDKQLEQIQAKRRAIAATNPKDKQGLSALKEQEQQVFKERQTLSEPIAKMQSSLGSEAEKYKKVIDGLDDRLAKGTITQEQYNTQMAQARSTLKGVEQAQERLNKVVADSTSGLSAFERAWQKIVDGLADVGSAIDKAGNDTRAAIAKAYVGADGSMTRGQTATAKELLQQEMLARKIGANQVALNQMTAELDSQDVATIRTNFNITDQTGAAELKTLAGRTSGAKEKSLLEKMAAQKEVELQTSELNAQLAEAQSSMQQTIEDSVKQANEFYRNIARGSQDLVLSLKKSGLETGLTTTKSRIQEALKGFNDTFIDEFGNKIIELIEMTVQMAQNSIDAQDQIMQRMRAYQDSQRQGAEMLMNAPGVGQMPDSGISAGQYDNAASNFANFQGNNAGKVVMMRTGEKDEHGLEKLLLRVYDKAGQVASEHLVNSGARGKQNLFGGANTTRSGSLAPVEYGTYNIGAGHASGLPGVGKTFIPVNPTFNTQRSAIGFHLDANRATSPGSAGCIVFKTEQDFNDFQKALKESGAKTFQFKEGKVLTQQVRQAGNQAKPQFPTPTPAARVPVTQQATRSAPSAMGNPLGMQQYRPRGGTISQAERVKSDKAGAIAMVQTAKRLGLDPLQFAALMSWESGGSLNPNIKGGDGNLYKGLIQFSPDNQQKYGTGKQQSIPEQLQAVERYLLDRGFKPGKHDIRGAYSAVLAGQADEKYWNRRDRNGTTVRNATPKFQRGDHYERGRQFLKDSGIDINNMGAIAAGSAMSAPGMGQVPTQMGMPQMSGSVGQEQITGALAMQAKDLEQFQAATLANVAARNSGLAQQIQRDLAKANKGLVRNVEDQDWETVQRDRKIQDMRFEQVEMTPKLQLEKELLGLARAREDFNRQIGRDVEKAQETYDKAVDLLAILEKGLADGTIPADIAKPAIANLKAQLPKIKENLDKTKAQVDEFNKELAKQEEFKREQYRLLTEQLKLEADKRILGVENELRTAQITRAQRTGDFAGSLELQRQSQTADVQMGLREQLFETEALARAGKITADEAARLKELYQQIAGVKLENLTSELQLQREEMNRTMQGQVFQSGMDLAGAQSSRLKGLGLNSQAREVDYQIAIAQQSNDYQAKTKEIDSLALKVGESNPAVLTLRENLESLNEVKLNDLKNQFSPMIDAVKGVKDATTGLFKDILKGDKDIGEALLSWVENMAETLASQAATLVSDTLFGSLFPDEKKAGQEVNAESLAAPLAQNFLGNTDDPAIAGQQFSSSVSQAGQVFIQAATSAGQAILNAVSGFPGFGQASTPTIGSQGSMGHTGIGLSKFGDGANSSPSPLAHVGMGLSKFASNDIAPTGGFGSIDSLGFSNPLIDAATQASQTLQYGVMEASDLFANSGNLAGNSLIGNLQQGLPNLMQGLAGSSGGMGFTGSFAGTMGGASPMGGGFLGGMGGSLLMMGLPLILGLFGKKKKDKEEKSEKETKKEKIPSWAYKTNDIANLPTYSTGGEVGHDGFAVPLRQRDDAIGRALRKEGSQSVLAALSPKEIVLNTRQAQRYKALGLDKVLNFKNGGEVPNMGGSVATPSFSQNNSSSTTISVPISIDNSGNSGDPGVDTKRLKEVVRTSILQELSNQKRSGGMLK